MLLTKTIPWSNFSDKHYIHNTQKSSICATYCLKLVGGQEMDSKNPIVEAAELQEAYKKLFSAKRLTKKAICDLGVPFRDKYNLTDLQTLKIMRNELTLIELVTLLWMNE